MTALAQPKIPAVTRLLTDSADAYESYVAAAEAYVKNIANTKATKTFDWPYQKPFAQGSGRSQYYMGMFQILNVLQAINLPDVATIAEVGSGPGWITEILASLGYGVECIEPCEDMIAIARNRVASRLRHHHLESNVGKVNFHCTTLEACELPEASVDAFMFYEALHHVVDEHQGLEKCFHALKEGGVIAITGEAVWSPENESLEKLCRDEMKRYGTLENPFSAEYLDYLLQEHGFERITRYHSINAFVPEQQGHRTVAELAQFHSRDHQNVIARKPWSILTTSVANQMQVAGRILVEQCNWVADGVVEAVLRIENTGQSLWLRDNDQPGQITISLFKENGRERIESGRYPIRQPLRPGESIVQTCRFTIDQPYDAWRFGLVNEQRFWVEQLEASNLLS